MADRRTMLMGLPKAAAPVLLLAVLALGLSACGSGTETTTTRIPPPVSASTADHLAKLSERVATYLDAGETCSAAHAADDLQAAIQDADLGDTIRPSVEETASRLVDGVNCPPPPPPPPEPEKEKKPKPKKGDENHQGEDKQKHSGHGGKVPPGHAKLEGEAG